MQGEDWGANSSGLYAPEKKIKNKKYYSYLLSNQCLVDLAQ